MSIIEKEYMGTKAITRTKPVPNLELTEPPMFNVVYVNDDVTTMEFVVESLMSVFNHTTDSAIALTQKIHDEGSGVAATLPFEMAEQKGIEVTQLARNNGFPLAIKLEPNV